MGPKEAITSSLLFGQTTFLIDCEKAAEDLLACQYTVEGGGGKYAPKFHPN